MGGLAGIVLRFVEEAFDGVDGLIAVRLDRAKHSMKRTIVGAACFAGAAIVATTGACAAVLALVRGLCGGLAALFSGSAWLGDLAGGVLALILVTGAVALAYRIHERRELARLKAKYERTRPRDERPTGSGTDDGGAVPRAGGGPSAPARDGLGRAAG
jgi:hypothetical protein